MKKTYAQTHICPECRSRKIIQDGGSGEIVCGDCGLVVSEIAINTGPEWRAFSLKEREDRIRIGLPIRFSLPDMGLSTTFIPSDSYGWRPNENTRFEMYRLKKWQHQISNNSTHKKNLSWAMLELDRLCCRLNLPKMVKEETAIIYRKILKKGLAQGRSISPLIAASLYSVCRMNQIPRALEEFSRHSPIDKKQIAQYYRMLLREMDFRVPVPKAKYGVSKIASETELSEKTQRKAIEILGEAERLKITAGRSPLGMAGAALYMACRANGETRTQKTLAEASGVTEVTIRNHCKALKEALGIKK
ncbi:MAG: HTH domain-containing protein [Dehalococcoidia bacterium]|nr:HTH domain-containing protein [Dehalococcoidia bacterium]